MHVSAHLDIDLVAIDAEEHVTCMLQLQAPRTPEDENRHGQTLVVALDRSGSMDGAPLEGAKKALRSLARRLSPQDSFGVIVFDDTATVVVPVRPVREHDPLDLDLAIAGINSGGGTDLATGYALALRHARRATLNRTETDDDRGLGATILILSDGHANAGEVDPGRLGKRAQANAYAWNITTSTVGLGLGYDEVLLSALARGGSGSHRFAEDVDTATAILAQEVDGLLAKAVIGAELRIRPQDGLVDAVGVLQDLPTWVEGGDTLAIALGDLYAGEQRRVVVGLHVPALPALGLATVADLTLEYTSLPDLAEHEVTLPVAVNVVPGDVAAGRVPDPVVVVAAALVGAAAGAEAAADALRRGDTTSAVTALDAAISRLAETASTLADSSSSELTASLRGDSEQVLRDLRAMAEQAQGSADPDAANRAAKSLTDATSALGRGRRQRGPRRAPSTQDRDITR